MTLHTSGLRRTFFSLARHALLATLSLAMATAQAAGPAGRKLTATELFNYAEKQYPTLFPSHAANQTLAPYTYRQYSTGNYLGVADGSVYLLGPASGGAIQALGKTDAFYCAVLPDECTQAPSALRSSSELLSAASYGADSLFMYQFVINSLAFDLLNILAPAPVTGTPATPMAGTFPLRCTVGSGSYTVIDADNSRTLSVGDRISIVTNDCVIGDTASKPRWTGAMDVVIAGGSDVHNYWASGDSTGAIELRVEMRDLKCQRGLLNGSYRYASSWLTKDADYTATTSFEDLSVKLAKATMQYTDLKLFYTGDTYLLSAAEGAVTVNATDLGKMRFELSVQKQMKVNQGSIRPRPTSGTLRLSGYGYNVDLNFVGEREAALVGDNGANGSSDFTMNAFESNLDAQLIP